MSGKTGKTAAFFPIFLALILFSGCVSREAPLGKGAALLGGAAPEASGENLTITFVSVGQGDAILINKGNFSALIDGGKAGFGTAISGEMNLSRDPSLELVVATHPDSDHIGGLPEVMRETNFSDVWDSGFPEDTKSYLAYSKEALRGNVLLPKAGFVLEREGIKMTVLNPEGNRSEGAISGDKNENSIVLLVSYGEIDILLTGDCEGSCEKALETGVPDIDILKVAHHGSKYATGSEFLRAALPEISVISVGKNSYGHPSNETIARLEAIGSRVIRTDSYGTVRIKTDGKTVYVE